MRALHSIAKITFLYSLRSYLFQLLLIILLMGVIGLPIAIVGDGTALGQLQLSLTYTLGFIKTILGCSIVGFSCFTIATDIENWKIQFLRSKPVPCWSIWLGKYLGVILIHGLLLMISTSALFFHILWKIESLNFGDEELRTLKSQIFVGRRVYSPQEFDHTVGIEKELRERREKGQISPGTDSAKLFKEIGLQQKLKRSEIPPNSEKKWEIKKVRETRHSKPFHLRYRFYTDDFSSRNQSDTYGVWWILNPEDQRYYPFPQRNSTGIFHEFALNSKVFDAEGNLVIKYENRDPNSKSVIIQPDDGPFILSKVTDFWQNYVRAVILVFIQLAFLTTIGCTAGSILSLPMAIFVSFSYVFLGILVVMLEFTFPEQEIRSDDLVANITGFVRNLTTQITVPMKEFDFFDYLTRGELIEVKRIFQLFLEVILFRGVPIGALGIWQISHRELGLVTRR